ncbi:MAG: dTDP-4-dehydrorhamnose 3,5-epimerase [Saprospiraceae bacterium]|nr:dTDP-4-dehydrorhamnose 3,5-epimerase [Saprospiraceae bacterium]
MKITETHIKGLFILEPKIFKDERGCFYETFNSKQFIRNNLSYFFVQDNEAESKFGVIRGLHYQHSTMAQAKLVRVTFGEVLDVVVDLRKGSPTFKSVFSIILSNENKKQLLIPRGFAHGYSVLSPSCLFQYKCDNYYAVSHEAGINPLDMSLSIDWKISEQDRIISSKDANLPFFNNARLD